MLVFFLQITVTQVTPYTAPAPAGGPAESIVRNKSFVLSACEKFTIKNGWENLSDTMEIDIPRNIYAIFSDGTKQPLASTLPFTGNGIENTKFASGFPVINGTTNPAPLFMRGDQITVRAGYAYPNGKLQDGNYSYTPLGAYNFPTVFTGYISEVSSTIPLKLKCEDSMWLLKQTSVPDKTYSASVDNMGTIFNDFINSVPPVQYSQGKTFAQLGYTVVRAPQGNAFFQLNINNFITKNDTWGSIFDRMKKKHRLYFYFRGKELRGGGIVYYPQDQTAFGFPNSSGQYPQFVFQKNIIKDDLKFQLKTDVSIGAVCYSMYNEPTTETNAKGGTKTATKRLQVNVGANKTDANEYFTFFFNVTNITDLTNKGNTQLNKYWYNGFKGKFTTIGLPYITHGNIVTIQDSLLPERNGNYLVRNVVRTFSVTGGYRQEITLHIRTNNLTSNDFNNGI